MNACLTTTSLMQQFHRLFGVLVLSLFSFQTAAYAAPAVDGKKMLRTTAPVNHADAGVKMALLTPSANPYALPANTGKQTVRFSVPVRLARSNKSPVNVFLRRRGHEQSIEMNDLGKNGDYVANDGIVGVNVEIDTSKIKPDTCLVYEAFAKESRTQLVSPVLRLCVSSFPVRVATPNIDKPVVLDDGVKAVADEVVLYSKPTTSAATIRELASSINAEVVGTILPLNLYQLKLPLPVSAKRILEIVAQLNARSEIVGAAVNALGQPAGHVDNTTDPEFANQDGVKLVLKHPMLAGVYVWDAGAIGTGQTVIVADEGLDRRHPEFGTPLPPPGNCQVINNDCGPSAANDDNSAAGYAQWHGTRVAGVIAAKANNTQGIAGVAHGSTIRPYKVASYALTNLAQIFIDAGSYVISDGASVINASFGGGPWSGVGYTLNVNALCTAVNTAVTSGLGAITVIAAGNNGADDWYYPARCNQHAAVPVANRSRIITVGNSTSVNTANCGSVIVDQRCAAAVPSNPNLLGSNYGTWVDIMAPGSDIRTTTSVGQGDGDGNNYTYSTGTSFSAPVVSGAVAILKSCGVSLDQIKSTLISSANVNVPYPTFGSLTTTPRLDIYRALSSVNHTPTGVGISNNSIFEKVDTSAGYMVGTLSATDVDTCDKFSFSIIPGGDAALFSINPAANTLILTAGVLNHATKPSFAVTVRVTDFFGLTFDQPLTVNVLNVNDAPAGTNTTVTTNENTAYAFSAANFGFTDPLDSPPNNLNAVIITTLPAAGQLKLGAVPVVAGQSVAAVSLGSLTFIPATNASGPAYASFTFQVVDDGGTANGGVNTDSTPNTLTINVTPVMTAPTGTPIVDPNPPTILNRKVPQVLSVDTSPVLNPDSWAVWGYQWRRSGADIGGATNSTYPLDYPDVGSYMSVCVKYSYDSGVTVATLCSNPDAIAVGDPHITTVDGLHYDFQSAGEFVALRGAGGMEIQVRQTPVSTANPITDGYSGLTSGVSINTAVAARVGTHRVSYQMKTNGNSASSGLELKVDHVVATPTMDGIDLGAGGRVVSAPGGGIQIDFPEQTTLVVTPYWWSWNNVWYLDVTVFHTSATEGIMGARFKGSWLPRLANGSALGAMPAAMHDRYVDMYVKFADSWRVNNDTSLFDYAPDTSTKTFTFKEWPKENPPYVIGNGPVAKPVKRQIAQQLCRGVVGKNENADCMFDVMVTGNRGIAKAHLFTQQVRAGLTSIIVSDDRGLSRDKEMVTFTATVARHAAATRMEFDRKGGAPTGTVQFTLNSNVVGKRVKLDAMGQAQLKLPRLKIEKQTIGARYVPAKGSIFFSSSSFESARVMVEGKR